MQTVSWVFTKKLDAVVWGLVEQGLWPVIVGGSVRDHWLDRPIKDYDIEVYGVPSMEALRGALEAFGRVDEVGRHFGVLKIRIGEDEVDVSLPRTESKVGAGHRGFTVVTDGALDFATAARRRDFTINAMGYDVANDAWLDPYGGRKDLADRVLRHVDAETFVEDPLRVYRAVQFAARFEMKLDEETFALCRRMVMQGQLDELPRERVWAEWQKLLLRSKRPSIGFDLMRDLGITERYFPQLHAIIDVPQSPEYHPEGDVWTHTMMAVDAMAKELEIRNEKLEISDKDRLVYMLAILCHDLGKATHTTIEYDGKVELYDPSTHYPLLTTHSSLHIRSIGHEAAGVDPTRAMLEKLTGEKALVEAVLPLVEHHLKPANYYRNGAKAKTIRRLSTKVSIRDLILVAKADFLGRDRDDARSGIDPAGEWLTERAQALGVYESPPAPLLHGRDLIALGMEPSPRFGELLDALYEEQLRGTIATRDEAMVWAKRRVGHEGK
jgi:tRNA nucleotidyltransferase (CCA-adding enzyme)